ncbi:MFS transporter [Aspergillus aculeatinus CBS 121060]|uniref:MFS general substrate transporter n=1 Tax=Aspergillus aculeatinus CBS 121060 TaxID=1448322 RepID=A0ACD1H881_9EURO|nr:MFS general substrate transporter [Aspergillus aculeatinus CBS 121060]RAH69839.1 MFS general substrate transporter [Aspergillus aculeatinus CBS 121060]
MAAVQEESTKTIKDVEAAAGQPQKEKVVDPYMVDWEGPDDPQCPMTWPLSKKVRQLAGMGVNSLLTPLSSSMFTPGEADVLAEFHTTNSTLGSFVVSIFLLGYVVGPLVIAPLSEMYGRCRLYHICNTLFLIFTIACAVAQTLPQLFVFRFFAGVAGSCPMTLGSGTVADLIPKEKRAGVMAIWAMGPILGPVIGPIAGSFVCANIGWRWVFWIIAIATGVMLIATLFCYRETYSVVLLERKAAHLRKETGNEKYRSKFDRGTPRKEIFRLAAVRPVKLLFLSPTVLLMALFGAVSYGYLYLMFTTITAIFEEVYGWRQEICGLAYLGFGLGAILGVQVTGYVANRIAAAHTAQGRFVPESRLIPCLYGSWLLPIGLFWYGWSADKQVHWIMPIIGTGIFGAGLMCVFLCINTYLVDSYLLYAASVTAANAVLRSLIGALLPLAGPSMYDALGLGWGNSLLAFIALVFCSFPVFYSRYGARIRTSPRFQLNL